MRWRPTIARSMHTSGGKISNISHKYFRLYNLSRTYLPKVNKSSNRGQSLNRSQCGGCSTEYNTLASN